MCVCVTGLFLPPVIHSGQADFPPVHSHFLRIAQGPSEPL